MACLFGLSPQVQCIQERDPHNSAALFSSLPDPKDRLQECWDNWQLDQFATGNCFSVCTVQKMSDNEEPPNYQGFCLVMLWLFPRDVANCFYQGERVRKTQKRRRDWIQLRVFLKLFLFVAILLLNPPLLCSCVARGGSLSFLFLTTKPSLFSLNIHPLIKGEPHDIIYPPVGPTA